MNIDDILAVSPKERAAQFIFQFIQVARRNEFFSSTVHNIGDVIFSIDKSDVSCFDSRVVQSFFNYDQLLLFLLFFHVHYIEIGFHGLKEIKMMIKYLANPANFKASF
jgi:hypothetical protein